MEKQTYKTKARQCILNCLKQNSQTTVSATDVLEFLNNNNIYVNLTTVYRYLNSLCKEQKINKFTDDNGQKFVYQLANTDNSCDEHIHIQCSDCGKLIHLDCEFMQDFKTHLYKNHQFSLKCKGSILYGICKDCAKK